MGPIWAIEPMAMRVLLAEMSAQIHAGHVAGVVDDARRAGLPVQAAGATAVISMSGTIVRRASWFSRLLGMSSSRELGQAIRAATRDENIERIVLLIDSPGGEAAGTAELADEVAAAAKVKPVIAQVEGMCCSAAYWVASQADKIYAARNDMIGSIGVIMMLYDFSKMVEEQGVKALPIDTGEFKHTGAMGTEITEAQQGYLQGLTDQIFEDFAASVQKGRGMNDASFKPVSDGRVFIARDALDAGLIDGIRTMEDTMAQTNKRAARKAQLAFSRSA